MDFKIFYPRLITETPFENNKIISYGLIVIAISTNRCIIVQRKHSVEFLIILLGHYRPSILPLLLPNITYDEQIVFDLLLKSNEETFLNVFNTIGLEQDVMYAHQRFQDAKETIAKFCQTPRVAPQLKWTWPKGRLNDQEDGFACAMREFKEEVEIDLPPPIFLSTEPIMVEQLKTLSCKTIETECWIYLIQDEIELSPVVDDPEVNDRQWETLKIALQKVQQEGLFEEIDNLMTNFRIKL